MANIVLAHGILGFGSIFPEQPISYFNGIKELYESYGHEVLCPSVAALGSLDHRADQLQEILENHIWKNNNSPIFMLAHSMGGLDCRRVIYRTDALRGRIKRLITVATPHFGSPVASVVLDPPPLLKFSPLQWIINLFENDAGALNDLKLQSHPPGNINPQDPDRISVEYLCIGCDSSKKHTSALFSATSLIGGFGEMPNDGVVSLASASKTNKASDLWATWPLDHGEAIGWPSGGVGNQFIKAVATPPSDHIERYRSLVSRLTA